MEGKGRGKVIGGEPDGSTPMHLWYPWKKYRGHHVPCDERKGTGREKQKMTEKYGNPPNGPSCRKKKMDACST